jgi:hypothetical protein
MTQPHLSPGDLLLHAGDLSIIGSQEEIQAQLDWISAQEHTYKVVIAGIMMFFSTRPISTPSLSANMGIQTLRLQILILEASSISKINQLL